MTFGRGVEKKSETERYSCNLPRTLFSYDTIFKKRRKKFFLFLFSTIVRGSFIFSFALRGSKRKRKKENSLCIVVNDQFTRFFSSFPRLSDVQLGA